MTEYERDEGTTDVSKPAATETGGPDPRATEHPTGAKQAAENAANESPS